MVEQELLQPSLAGVNAPAALYAPSPVYLTGEDQLRLTSVGNAAGVTLTCAYRILLPTGRITSTTFLHAPNSNRTTGATTKALSEGWLLGLEVRVSGGTTTRNAVWAIVELVRPQGAAVDVMQSIAFDFVGATAPLVWPGGANVGPVDGGGSLRVITGSVPGAGADISETVPTGARWELVSFEAQLTTSVTVATRFARLLFDDGANTYFRCPFGAGQAASTVFVYDWFEGGFVTTYSDPAANAGGVPVGNRLLAGHRIRTLTGNIQAGDQWTAPKYLVKEWFDV